MQSTADNTATDQGTPPGDHHPPASRPTGVELTPEIRGAYGGRMTRFVITLGIAFVTAGVAAACGPGPLDEVEDFTAEVERNCADYCELNLACEPTPGFELYDECEHVCLHDGFVYNDTVCGEAARAVTECIGSQPTCELFLDTYNVHADEYTCQAEKDGWAEVSEGCWSGDEDPFPKGKP